MLVLVCLCRNPLNFFCLSSETPVQYFLADCQLSEYVWTMFLLKVLQTIRAALGKV